MKKIQSDIVNIENISDRDRESGTVLHKQKVFFSVKLATIFQKIAKFRQNVYNLMEHYYSFDRSFFKFVQKLFTIERMVKPCVCS